AGPARPDVGGVALRPRHRARAADAPGHPRNDVRPAGGAARPAARGRRRGPGPILHDEDRYTPVLRPGVVRPAAVGGAWVVPGDGPGVDVGDAHVPRPAARRGGDEGADDRGRPRRLQPGAGALPAAGELLDPGPHRPARPPDRLVQPVSGEWRASAGWSVP